MDGPYHQRLWDRVLFFEGKKQNHAPDLLHAPKVQCAHLRFHVHSVHQGDDETAVGQWLRPSHSWRGLHRRVNLSLNLDSSILGLGPNLENAQVEMLLPATQPPSEITWKGPPPLIVRWLFAYPRDDHHDKHASAW